MKRKRHRPIFVRNCDYCGTELQLNEPNSDSYVVTIEHKYFCKIHHVGESQLKIVQRIISGVKIMPNYKKKKKASYAHSKKSAFKTKKTKKKKY